MGLRVPRKLFRCLLLGPLGCELWRAFLIVLEGCKGEERPTEASVSLQPARGQQTLPSVRRVRAWNGNHIL